MSETLREHLLGTLAHMSLKRGRLLKELSEVEDLMKTLQREVDSLPKRIKSESDHAIGTFSGFSLRWAILMYFCRFASGPETIGDLAIALRARGAGEKSKALNFNSNVSAVLSQMTGKGEITKNGDRFTITDEGRAVWHGIEDSEGFTDSQIEREKVNA